MAKETCVSICSKESEEVDPKFVAYLERLEELDEEFRLEDGAPIDRDVYDDLFEAFGCFAINASFDVCCLTFDDVIQILHEHRQEIELGFNLSNEAHRACEALRLARRMKQRAEFWIQELDYQNTKGIYSK